MAYVSQELKAKLAPTIKAICKKHGVKASIGVKNHSTLVLNIKSSKIDFIKDYNTIREAHWNSPWDFTPVSDSFNVNEFHYKNMHTGKALKFLSEVIPAMNDGNFDNSDIQTDYFNVGWYINVNVGQWNKPYILEK